MRRSHTVIISCLLLLTRLLAFDCIAQENDARATNARTMRPVIAGANTPCRQ